MSNQTLDELRALSNKAMQEKQAEADNFRPKTKPLMTEFVADVKVTIETRTGAAQDGEPWSSKVVCLNLSNGDILATYRDQPAPSNSFSEATYDINWAERAKSQLGYTTASIAEALGDEGASIVDIDGKRAHFKERIIAAPTHKGSPRTIKLTKGKYAGEERTLENGDTIIDAAGFRMKPTYYYAVVEVLGAKPVAETDAKAKDAALGFAVGKTKGEFTSGVVGYVKEQGLNVSDTDQLYFISKFLPEMTSAGKLTLDDEKKFVLASL